MGLTRTGAPGSAIMRRGRWYSSTMAAKYTRGESARWAADVAGCTEDTGPRLLCAPQRIHLGDRPDEPGPQGQNRKSPRSDISMFNRPDKLLGAHPLNWFSLRFSLVTRQLPSVVTPDHSPIDTSLSQLWSPSQFGPSVAL